MPEQQSHIKIPRALVAAGVIILVVGGLAIVASIGYLVFYSTDDDNSVNVSRGLIVADDATGIAINNSDRQATIESVRQAVAQLPPPSRGDMITIPLSREAGGFGQIPVDELLSRMAPGIPDSLTATLGNRYVYGVIGQSKAPFLVLSVNDAGNVYGPMQEWESSLYSDLHPIITPDGPDGVTGTFEDIYVANNSARGLKNAGDTVMAYMTLDNKTLAIAPDKPTLAALLRARQNAKKELRSE